MHLHANYALNMRGSGVHYPVQGIHRGRCDDICNRFAIASVDSSSPRVESPGRELQLNRPCCLMHQSSMATWEARCCNGHGSGSATLRCDAGTRRQSSNSTKAARCRLRHSIYRVKTSACCSLNHRVNVRARIRALLVRTLQDCLHHLRAALDSRR